MRDLGRMGESKFSFWCADSGLIANGSEIDKTGWDYFVEFPFDVSAESTEVHKSAFECKVQVKATDKNNRKLSIKLSNLRRLITAPMPSFFIFIEFDNLSEAQKAFIVHVDNELIAKVLKRLHSVQQSKEDNKFNKRTMTIYYDESQKMPELNGACLKKILLGYMGSDMAEYVAKKKEFLETTGFEKGFSQITFNTACKEDLKKLIDVSIGIEKEVDVTVTRAIETRFGIVSKSPFLDFDKARLGMPNLKPMSKGTIKFKEKKLSTGLAFDAQLYVSPFNKVVPEEFRKMRVQGEFFDLELNPYTGTAKYSFSLGEGIRMEVKKFRNAIKLITQLHNSGKNLFAELIFEDLPRFKFDIGRIQNRNIDLSDELKALESSIILLADFDVTDYVDISLDEVTCYKTEICQLESIADTDAKEFKIEFSIEGDVLDQSQDIACVFLLNAPVGSHTLGLILVAVGSVEAIENNRFRLIPNDVIIESRVTSEKDEAIDNDDLVALVKEIKGKYTEYNVLTLFGLPQSQ